MSEPIEAAVRRKMNDLAERLDSMFNGDRYGTDRKWGFALLVFPSNEADAMRVNYISNCDREQMLAALKELVARWERPDPDERGRMQ